jgi:hypothetical protein
MKQTAVEFLFKIWLKKEHISPNEWSEALEMQKQQMCQFAFAYQDEFFNNGKVAPIEQYYNETFKQQEQ